MLATNQALHAQAAQGRSRVATMAWADYSGGVMDPSNHIVKYLPILLLCSCSSVGTAAWQTIEAGPEPEIFPDAAAESTPDATTCQGEWTAYPDDAGTYDTDCDGVATLRWPDGARCDNATACDERAGLWELPVPACGQIGIWILECSRPDAITCRTLTEDRRQECK